MPADETSTETERRARIEAGLARGLAQYRAGDLGGAERTCAEVLHNDPRQAQAIALLGLIHMGRNEPREALRRFDASLEIEPSQASVLVNRGNALKALDRMADALASYDRAIAIRPRSPVTFSNRGLVLQALGRCEEALESYDKAIALDAGFVEALHHRGNLLLALSRRLEALADLDRAIALKPRHGTLHYNRGNVLLELGRHEDALACYERATALGADDADTRNNMGVTLQALGRHEAALANFEVAIARAPNDARGHYNRANALHRLGRHEAALESYAKATALAPDHADACNNWGNALLALDRYEDALARYDDAIRLAPGLARAHYNRAKALAALLRHREALVGLEQAVALEPDHVPAWNDCGLALLALGRYREASASFDRAIALAPDDAASHWNKGLLRLLQGDFAEGWRLYEWRRRNEKLDRPRLDLAAPLWLGQERLDGKSILLHAEQGFGDTVQFCRYAALVAEKGATVCLDVPGPLKTLMETLDGPHSVATATSRSQPFDYQTPLLSLPLAFATEPSSIPARVPYLHADPRAAAEWAERLRPHAMPRVGLVWSGKPTFANDRNRSIPLAALLPLLDVDASFFGLQKEVRREDEAALASASRQTDLGASLGDFADTAALIENLDLLISVDTAAAHVAGALGKPVWILLPFAPDWRWMLDRDDSPWYPTARLFRQTKIGDWPGVIARVAACLREWVRQGPQAQGRSARS